MSRKIVSVSEMVAIEKAATQIGISYAQMMETAGKNLARAVQSEFKQAPYKVLGLVGKGNNGGDTLIGLEVLAKLGWPASAYIVGERDREDVLVARCRQAGTALIWWEE
ncbi:MAG: hypothetical protein OEY93_08260, partial [Anaerolineae bacterium]|nr:hypothetical protein [Anaerolineae bacterium]